MIPSGLNGNILIVSLVSTGTSIAVIRSMLTPPKSRVLGPDSAQLDGGDVLVVIEAPIELTASAAKGSYLTHRAHSHNLARVSPVFSRMLSSETQNRIRRRPGFSDFLRYPANRYFIHRKPEVYRLRPGLIIPRKRSEMIFIRQTSTSEPLGILLVASMLSPPQSSLVV